MDQAQTQTERMSSSNGGNPTTDLILEAQRYIEDGGQCRPRCKGCNKMLPLETPEWKKLCLGCYYGILPLKPGKCLILSDSDDE